MSSPVIGLVGGLSWSSTSEYYKLLNQIWQQKHLGQPEILLKSVDFGFVEKLQKSHNLDQLETYMTKQCVFLQDAGASCVAVCANTMHRFSDTFEKNLNVPFLSIIDSTAWAIKNLGFKKVGLLGTRPTMEMQFYRHGLQQFGIQCITPDDATRTLVSDAIYNEMVVGQFLATTQKAFLAAIDNFKEQGVQAVILGCTEIPILLNDCTPSLPTINTTKEHVESILKWYANERTNFHEQKSSSL